jgi:hypothetical protein
MVVNHSRAIGKKRAAHAALFLRNLQVNASLR